MVVFHWWVEKGLVTLGGSVISWSPTVDRSDSGTVGRSQAGRPLIASSEGRKNTGKSKTIIISKYSTLLLKCSGYRIT